jgi:S1-C subfamily serine protease
MMSRNKLFEGADVVWKTALRVFFALSFVVMMITVAYAEMEELIHEPATVMDSKEGVSPGVQICNSSRCSAHGSGFHLYDGYFITAAHVVGASKKMWIKNSEGQQQGADVLWTSSQHDLSLLYVEAWNFLSPPENQISCEEQKVGENILVIGYPADLGNVTTHGSLLGVKKGTIGRWSDPYIADITIFFGNSGGPVFNERNEVFGIAVGGLRGTSFSLIEPLSKICDILPPKKDVKNDNK